jgi:hypothetical protein
MLSLLLGVLCTLAQSSPLDEIEARVKAASKDDPAARHAAAIIASKEVLKLVQDDKLATPAELRRAAMLVQPEYGDFPATQAAYELALSAAAGGDEPALALLGDRWDMLLPAMSRGRRLGLLKIPDGLGTERYRVNRTAKTIVEVYRDPAAAKRRAEGATDNAEMKRTVDADQAARQGDWSKLTPEQMEQTARDDDARLKRAKDLVRGGKLRTANDFANAALVCQHGSTFEDYALAHELSVCALLLGRKEAAWLAGASYDRMLSNSGYQQRFGTQYAISGGQVRLMRVDETYINDTERRLVVRVTLAEARDRKWD